jgi:beta-barrel assembly-enhancing protease
MQKPVFSRRRPFRSAISTRITATALALVLSLGITLSLAPNSLALSWVDLIRGGVRVYQSVQLSNLSDKEEVKLGEQINDELFKKELKAYKDSSINAYIDQIGQRLALNNKRPKLPFKFQVVDDKQVNAYATAGGFVYVTTGLLRTAENEAEVAGVIGHEIGHVEGKHLIAQMSRQAFQEGLITAAGLDRSKAIQIGVDLAVRRPRSRENEFDADQRGLRIMSTSGYAPTGMVSFMEKLQKLSSNVPTILSTHPNGADRVVALKKNLQANPANPSSTNPGLDNAAYIAKIKAGGLQPIAQTPAPTVSPSPAR